MTFLHEWPDPDQARRARDEIEEIRKDNPGLGAYGYQTSDTDREHMTSPNSIVSYLQAREYIFANHKDKKAITGGSYGLKHCVERWFQAKGQPCYCANGMFIAAALSLGLKVVPAKERGNPNATISVIRVKAD